jgi:hypothetical protein
MSTLQQTLAVAGLAIVVSMIVAVVIQGIVVVLGRSGMRRARAVLTARPAVAMDSRPPPAHVVAIAAAVSVVLSAGRIVHIEPRRQDSAWADAGRQAHRSSHNLGRRTRRNLSGPPNTR